MENQIPDQLNPFLSSSSEEPIVITIQDSAPTPQIFYAYATPKPLPQIAQKRIPRSQLRV